MRDVPDRLVLDLATLPVGAAQQMRYVLPLLPLPPIGDNVNRTSWARSPRHRRTIPPPPDGLIIRIDDYICSHQKGRNPSNHRDSGLSSSGYWRELGLAAVDAPLDLLTRMSETRRRLRPLPRMEWGVELASSGGLPAAWPEATERIAPHPFIPTTPARTCSRTRPECATPGNRGTHVVRVSARAAAVALRRT